MPIPDTVGSNAARTPMATTTVRLKMIPTVTTWFTVAKTMAMPDAVVILVLPVVVDSDNYFRSPTFHSY